MQTTWVRGAESQLINLAHIDNIVLKQWTTEWSVLANSVDDGWYCLYKGNEADAKSVLRALEMQLAVFDPYKQVHES